MTLCSCRDFHIQELTNSYLTAEQTLNLISEIFFTVSQKGDNGKRDGNSQNNQAYRRHELKTTTTTTKNNQPTINNNNNMLMGIVTMTTLVQRIAVLCHVGCTFPLFQLSPVIACRMQVEKVIL